MARRIESLLLEGPAGRLECLLEEPDNAPPREAALVCHPHPQHGGTMHNKVVYRVARGLRSAGAVVLRFNYRGVNQSDGTYAHGEGELDDARVALASLRERYPNLPFTIAGFSFGSRIALRMACEKPLPRRVIAVGFPASQYKIKVENCGVPLVFVQSTHDQFGSVAELTALVQSLSEPKRLVLVDAQDHFFAGALEKLEEEIARLDPKLE